MQNSSIVFETATLCAALQSILQYKKFEKGCKSHEICLTWPFLNDTLQRSPSELKELLNGSAKMWCYQWEKKLKIWMLSEAVTRNLGLPESTKALFNASKILQPFQPLNKRTLQKIAKPDLLSLDCNDSRNRCELRLLYWGSYTSCTIRFLYMLFEPGAQREPQELLE